MAVPRRAGPGGPPARRRAVLRPRRRQPRPTAGLTLAFAQSRGDRRSERTLDEYAGCVPPSVIYDSATVLLVPGMSVGLWGLTLISKSVMPWWDSYIKPVAPKEENKFATVGYQRQLAAELHRVEPNSEAGHEQMAETLRTVAEMMVWGDKNDRTVLDYFLEQNIVGHFVGLLSQRPSKNVTCQVVNHLSMLLQSLNSPEAVFFLLSNNHINLLINHNFDFTDEEVASYYVSFLKSISLRLNVSTVQLFFNATTKEFPLFVEATKFFDHPESMVPPPCTPRYQHVACAAHMLPTYEVL